MKGRRYKQRRPSRPRATPAPAPRPPRRRRRWIRRARNLALLAIVLAVTLAAIAWIIVRQRIDTTPEWWQPPQVAPEVARVEAQAIEREVSAAMTDLRDADESWTLTLTEAQANHWFAERLPRWLANRRITLPTPVHRLLVDFAPGAVTFGAAVDHEGAERIVGVSIEPRLQDGALFAPASRLSIGTLRLPADAVLTRLPPSLLQPREDVDLGEILLDRRPALAPPELSLGDGRRIRITALEFHEDRLTATCITLPATPD